MRISHFVMFMFNLHYLSQQLLLCLSRAFHPAFRRPRLGSKASSIPIPMRKSKPIRRKARGKEHLPTGETYKKGISRQGAREGTPPYRWSDWLTWLMWDPREGTPPYRRDLDLESRYYSTQKGRTIDLWFELYNSWRKFVVIYVFKSFTALLLSPTTI